MRGIAGRLDALTGSRRLAMAAAMGLVLGFAHTPFGLWPLAFVAGAVLYRLWRAGGGFGAGWAAGAAFFALTLHWIIEPFLVDAPRYGWMAPFALVLMAGGLALFWGAAFWLAGRIRTGGPAALALTWGGMEALRGGIFTGFPWVLPAYIWIETPVAQAASLLGSYGLSIATLLAMLALGAGAWKWISPAVIAGVLAVWLWGDARISPAPEPDANDTATLVRIIQPNILQSQKWDRAYARLNFDKALALTGAAPTQGRAPMSLSGPRLRCLS